ncbi:MAG: hypothetical protein E6343_14470 [Clostridium perfringens]|nr:hypothetical protein [Clostridium perfringens]
MEAIIDDILVARQLNNPIKVELLLLKYIERIMDLKPRGDYIFGDTVIKDIKENEYTYIFCDTFKNIETNLQQKSTYWDLKF